MNKKYITLALITILFSACGSTSDDTPNNDGKGAIDLASYYPSSKVDHKIFLSEVDGADQPSQYQQIKVTDNTITTTVGTKVIEKVVFSDTNITTTLEDNKVDTMYRHVDIGDTLSREAINSSKNIDLGKMITKLNSFCIVKSKENSFEQGTHSYKGDLLKLECLTEGTVVYDIKPSLLSVVSPDLNGSHPIYNKSYAYLQKDLGLVAEINDDCVSLEGFNGNPLIDDRKNPKDCKSTKSNYKFYLP
jgi:hypothetical protein